MEKVPFGETTLGAALGAAVLLAVLAIIVGQSCAGGFDLMVIATELAR